MRSLLLLVAADAAVVRETLVIQEWVVDYLRPTVDIEGRWPWDTAAERESPFEIADAQRALKYLVNGTYPGPTIRCAENDTVELLVVNELFSEATTIHWHGVHMPGTPYMDGARGVTQGPIAPGENFTYRFQAWPPGTHYYHSHMDAVQGSRGLKGAFVIERADDPVKAQFAYDEDQVVFLSDEWRDPSVCLKVEGAMPGNDVCADIRHASFNGQYGNGSDAYPFALLPVEAGKCYRQRWIAAFSNTENLVVSLAGHNMTLVSVDGAYDVAPLAVSSFNIHLGERVDVIVCADQRPGNYLVNATYDYACALTPGNFIPPGFAAVPTCQFFAYLHYKGESTTPRDLAGTGGGARARAVAGAAFDLTRPEAWALTTPRAPEPEPEEPDVRYTINFGLLGPTYDGATDAPLSKGRWYMDLAEKNPPRSYEIPKTPLYRTQGTCGAKDIPVIDIPENATTVEIVLQNLGPAAHVLHMHGMPFKVINVANFTSWCGLDKSSCFGLPWWSPLSVLNKCPTKLRTPGDPNNPNIELGGYWGCAFDPETDKATQNLDTPLIKDSMQLWQRSWAVIRFKATRPGFWYFHCHETQHLMLGLQMVFNVLPSRQPPIPADVPSSGWCKTVNGA